MRILGIDPAKRASGIAFIFTLGGELSDYTATLILEDASPGMFDDVLRHKYPFAEANVAFIEITPGMGPKISAKALSVLAEVRGMALEACAVNGIPAIDIQLDVWRSLVLGKKPVSKNDAGKAWTGWTKGNRRDGRPDTLTPAVDAALESRGISIEGRTMDEKEAICIALAGYELIKMGDITIEGAKL